MVKYQNTIMPANRQSYEHYQAEYEVPIPIRSCLEGGEFYGI